MEYFIEWFQGIEQQYGVNPYIFASIYIGAIPIFWIFTIQMIKNLRKRKSITFPVLGMSFCAVSSYIYLLIAGENIPLWVYAVIVAMIGYALYSVKVKASKKSREVVNEL